MSEPVYIWTRLVDAQGFSCATGTVNAARTAYHSGQAAHVTHYLITPRGSSYFQWPSWHLQVRVGVMRFRGRNDSRRAAKGPWRRRSRGARIADHGYNSARRTRCQGCLLGLSPQELPRRYRWGFPRRWRPRGYSWMAETALEDGVCTGIQVGCW